MFIVAAACAPSAAATIASRGSQSGGVAGDVESGHRGGLVLAGLDGSIIRELAAEHLGKLGALTLRRHEEQCVALALRAVIEKNSIEMSVTVHTGDAFLEQLNAVGLEMRTLGETEPRWTVGA